MSARARLTNAEYCSRYRRKHKQAYPLDRIARRIYKRDGKPECLKPYRVVKTWTGSLHEISTQETQIIYKRVEQIRNDPRIRRIVAQDIKNHKRVPRANSTTLEWGIYCESLARRAGIDT